MNIHHLELFYYVARHGGISEAVRNIPYGIQQPAVSSQVIQLEERLGMTLFQRRPFELTAAGRELYGFIEPFFGNLDKVEERIRGDMSQQVRIGAAEMVLRDHLPQILRSVRAQHPKLQVSLQEGYQAELGAWLQKRELDLIITLLDGKAASGTETIPLLELPLVLVVEKGSRLRSAEELWKRDRIEEKLICMPPNEAITKAFHKGLSRFGVDWFPGIEVSSLALIEAYVSNGFGVGVSVFPPKSKVPPGLRYLPLPDFPKVTLGVVWCGKPTALMETLANAMRRYAEQLGKQPAG